MPVDIDSPEGHIIRKMVPFSTMPNSIFKVICDKIVVENARSGTFLFKRGDTAKELIYLLKGEVSLEVDKLKMEVIKAGTESARFALAHQLPRKVNGVAKGSVQFLRLNSIYITTPEHLSNAKKTTSATTLAKDSNKENTQTWMSTLLMIPAFRILPPAKLSQINEQLEAVNYKESDVVIKQGDVAEYYYVIKSGECLLSHKEAVSERPPTVSKLKMWDSFGAEALISNTLQNHSVTALTDLSVLRIGKDKFLTLIKTPLLKFVDVLETQSLLDGGGILLDVRPAADYDKWHLPEAINIPLLDLRSEINKLEKNRPIVVVSDKQNLSQSAAFLLLSYKFSAHVAKKNLEPMPTELVINIRKPVSHSFTSPVVQSDTIELDLSDNEQLTLSDKVVVTTRSVPKHTASTELLVTENSALKQQLNELKSRYEKIEQEKQDITQKYQLLLKQSERLKAMLESLTRYNGKI